jgi:ribose transport system permease protein
VLAVLAAGGGIGAVNGILVAKAGINAVVATLGIGTILVGVSYTYSNGQPIATGLPTVFLNFALGKVLGVPKPVIITAAVLIVLWIIVNLTDLGQKLQAVGGNPEAARLSGIPVDRVKIFAFVTSGVCAALTGIMLSSLIGSGTLAAGDGYLLSAFAAVFLGSATLRDGEFHIIGTVIGVLIINTGINGLSIVGVATSYQNIFTGSVLIIGVGLSTVARRYTTR